MSEMKNLVRTSFLLACIAILSVSSSPCEESYFDFEAGNIIHADSFKLQSKGEIKLPEEVSKDSGHMRIAPLVGDLFLASKDTINGEGNTLQIKEAYILRCPTISKISEKKAKLIGSASINIKEYPMEKKKGDKIRIGSHAWLDI